MLAAGCGSHERSPRALAVLSGASGAIIIATTLYRDSSYRRLRQLSSYEEVCFKCLAALVVHRHISIPSCTFSTTKFGHRKSAYHDCVLMLSMPPFIIGRRKCGIWAQRPWKSSEALSKAKSAKAVSLTPRSMELNTSSRLPEKSPWPDSSSNRTQPKPHQSTAAVWPVFLTISGAMYSAVPTKLYARPLQSFAENHTACSSHGRPTTCSWASHLYA